jgi:hypothetical protein
MQIDGATLAIRGPFAELGRAARTAPVSSAS